MEKDTSTLSTKIYFEEKDGRADNFFDGISAPALMQSVVGTVDNRDNFQEVQSEKGNVVAESSKSSQEFVSSKDLEVEVCKDDETNVEKLNVRSEEPVVCRIFSSPQNEPSKPQETRTNPGSSFFDMLGTPTLDDLQSPFTEDSLDGKRIGLSFLIPEQTNGSTLGT